MEIVCKYYREHRRHHWERNEMNPYFDYEHEHDMSDIIIRACARNRQKCMGATKYPYRYSYPYPN